jgi:hypothetical protein
LVICWKFMAAVLSEDWSTMRHFAHEQAAVLKQCILKFSGYIWTKNQMEGNFDEIVHELYINNETSKAHLEELQVQLVERLRAIHIPVGQLAH